MKRLKPVLTLLISFITIFLSAQEVSMSNIKIGDSVEKLNKINIEKDEYEIIEIESGSSVNRKNDGEFDFLLPDGNQISFSIKNGIILFIKNEWAGDYNHIASLLPNFEFNKTSLEDITSFIGISCYYYENYIIKTSLSYIFYYNCFRLDTEQSEVLVLITTTPIDSREYESSKLYSIIIADEKYLDSLWGESKLFDEGIKINPRKIFKP